MVSFGRGDLFRYLSLFLTDFMFAARRRPCLLLGVLAYVKPRRARHEIDSRRTREGGTFSKVDEKHSARSVLSSGE